LGTDVRLSAGEVKETIKELSHVYEELSLLYRAAGQFSGLGVSEVCGVLLDEALGVVPSVAGGVFIADGESDRLVPRAVAGAWTDSGPALSGRDPLLRQLLQEGRILAVCDVKGSEYDALIPGARGVLVVPLQGNARVVGLLVLTEKSDGGDYFSSETKLLSALAYQAGLSIENAILMEENRSILLGSFRVLIKTLEAASKWTAGHSERVAGYCREVAEALGLSRDFTDQLQICATLHDLGKVALPAGILDGPDRLTSIQRKLVDDHPIRGAAILEEIGPLAAVVAGIRHHHERWDGKGYPDGLAGEDIPLMARVVGVADAFDAMTQDRPYKRRMSAEAAVEELYCEAGIQFDPEIVAVFTARYRRKGRVSSESKKIGRRVTK